MEGIKVRSFNDLLLKYGDTTSNDDSLHVDPTHIQKTYGSKNSSKTKSDHKKTITASRAKARGKARPRRSTLKNERENKNPSQDSQDPVQTSDSVKENQKDKKKALSRKKGCSKQQTEKTIITDAEDWELEKQREFEDVMNFPLIVKKVDD